MTVSSSASIDPIIDDRVYIGNLAAALSPECRAEFGITHILSVCPENPSTPGDKSHLTIPVQDSYYQDLLIHLPRACCFIQTALDQGGKILVHCVMGVSRSATVVCAYLMWSRKLSAVKAVAFAKKRRPQVHPNYGFMKQLQAFASCHYDPSPNNSAYRAWKRRRMQDVTHFLNAMSDTTAVIPDKLYMSNEFPDNPEEAEALLQDMGMTHIISLSPAQLQLPPNVMSSVNHRHINIPAYKPESLLVALPQICEFICHAIDSGGQVLVHCVIESRACIAVSAYLMHSQNICAAKAFAMIEDALPLFDPTPPFHKQLELFETCKCKPSPSHPVVKAWVAEISGAPPPPPASTSVATTLLLNATANRLLSGTKHDITSFNETLKNIQTSVLS